MPIDEMDEEMYDIEEKIYWCYYDEEEEFMKLLDSLNSRGIREKKL